MTNYQVLEWMTPHPITISPQTTLPQVRKLMHDRKIRRLPVMDNGQLIGIVTMSDVLRAMPSEASALNAFEINYLLDKLTASQFMTRQVITVEPTTTVRDAAMIMLTRKISGLPVVKQGVMVGIITESDIFRMLVRELVNAPTL
jgi:CBS domain-containing protein